MNIDIEKLSEHLNATGVAYYLALDGSAAQCDCLKEVCAALSELTLRRKRVAMAEDSRSFGRDTLKLRQWLAEIAAIEREIEEVKP